MIMLVVVRFACVQRWFSLDAVVVHRWLSCVWSDGRCVNSGFSCVSYVVQLCDLEHVIIQGWCIISWYNGSWFTFGAKHG